MDHLDQLESESVYILREAFNRIEKLAMLWSLGKDSNTMIWLAKKAFFGRVPFPVVHVAHGHRHISEFTHALIGTELARRIAAREPNQRAAFAPR